MKQPLLFFTFLLITTFLSAQHIITAEDLTPNIGDKWFWGTENYEVGPFTIDFGEPGVDATFDFSGYENTIDLFTGLPMTELNVSNAHYTMEIIALEDLPEMPEEFKSADFVLKLQEHPQGALWYMPYEIMTEGLVVLGEMNWNEGSTPASWTYHEGFSYGPGRNIPFDLELGENRTMTRSVLSKTWSTGNDSLVIVDNYIFDATGTYYPPSENEPIAVNRLIHNSSFYIYSDYSGSWELTDQLDQCFVEYRADGYLLPLAEVYLSEEWNTTVDVDSSDQISTDFNFPTFEILSNIDKKTAVAAEFYLFPNPTQDYINLNWTGVSTGNAKAEWYNVQGKLLAIADLNELNQNESYRINTPESAGIYLLKIKTDFGSHFQRIIVE